METEERFDRLDGRFEHMEKDIHGILVRFAVIETILKGRGTNFNLAISLITAAGVLVTVLKSFGAV